MEHLVKQLLTLLLVTLIPLAVMAELDLPEIPDDTMTFESKYFDIGGGDKTEKEFRKKLQMVYRDGKTLEEMLFESFGKYDFYEFDEDQFTEYADRVVDGDFEMEKGIFIPVKEAFEKDKAKYLTLLGITGLLLCFDQEVYDFVQKYKGDDSNILSRLGDHMGSDSLVATVGSSYVLGSLIGGTLVTGLVFKNNDLKEAAISSMKSAILGQITVEFLKAMTHRSRPREGMGPYDFQGPDWTSDNTSFPSGHSAGAWSVATIYAKKFGKKNKLVPIVAYGLATITSWSRIHDGAHWGSDVVLGATIGYFSGSVIHEFDERRHRNDEKEKEREDYLKNIMLSPDIREDYAGLSLSFTINPNYQGPSPIQRFFNFFKRR